MRIFIALTILTAGVQANDSNYCAAIAVEDRIGTGCNHTDATTVSASSTTNLFPLFPTQNSYTHSVKATGAVGITRTTT